MVRLSCDIDHLVARNVAVMERARQALKRAQRVQAQCDALDERINAALSLSDATSHRLLAVPSGAYRKKGPT